MRHAKRTESKQAANLLLFQAEDDTGKQHTFGAFSSHGWDGVQKGDETSFLFNLTENLKFTTISRTYLAHDQSNKAYTWVKHADNQKTGKYELHFGQKELVVKSDFKQVCSDLVNSYYFTLYGDLQLRDRLDSLVPESQTLTPKMVEIWLFEEPPNIFYNNKLNEDSFKTDTDMDQSSFDSKL